MDLHDPIHGRRLPPFAPDEVRVLGRLDADGAGKGYPEVGPELFSVQVGEGAGHHPRTEVSVPGLVLSLQDLCVRVRACGFGGVCLSMLHALFSFFYLI